MKIIYLHQYFNTPSMQGSTRSYEMARRLVERGHQVCMVTSWREVTDQAGWFASYDALIFPTGYDGEGFPGVVVNTMLIRSFHRCCSKWAFAIGRFFE